MIRHPVWATLLRSNCSIASSHFTALFAYNDISAIGAICAFQESGIRVPEDISVVGFDDIQTAAYMTPPLTTVRQPLKKNGGDRGTDTAGTNRGEHEVCSRNSDHA